MITDTTCYTGCTPTTSGIAPGPSPAVPLATHAPTGVPMAHGLPFTGADIAEMAVIAIVFIAVGIVLLWSARARRHV